MVFELRRCGELWLKFISVLTHECFKVGQIPFLDRLFLKNPIRRWLSAYGFTPSTPVAVFASKRIQESKVNASEKARQPDTKSRRDFLSRFQEAHEKDPEFISQERVLALTVANMVAGSDTTAIS